MADETPVPAAPELDIRDVNFILKTLARGTIVLGEDLDQATVTVTKLRVLFEYLKNKEKAK